MIKKDYKQTFADLLTKNSSIFGIFRDNNQEIIYY